MSHELKDALILLYCFHAQVMGAFTCHINAIQVYSNILSYKSYLIYASIHASIHSIHAIYKTQTWPPAKLKLTELGYLRLDLCNLSFPM